MCVLLHMFVAIQTKPIVRVSNRLFVTALPCARSFYLLSLYADTLLPKMRTTVTLRFENDPGFDFIMLPQPVMSMHCCGMNVTL